MSEDYFKNHEFRSNIKDRIQLSQINLDTVYVLTYMPTLYIIKNF